jgi:hypothetical protein
MFAARQPVALDKAGERHGQVACVAQRGGGVADFSGALLVLAADVEQCDARAGEVHRDAGIGCPHHGELDEVLGLDLGIRAEVEHDHIVLAQRWKQRCKCRPINARYGAKRKLGHRHQCAGIAG